MRQELPSFTYYKLKYMLVHLEGMGRLWFADKASSVVFTPVKLRKLWNYKTYPNWLSGNAFSVLRLAWSPTTATVPDSVWKTASNMRNHTLGKCMRKRCKFPRTKIRFSTEHSAFAQRYFQFKSNWNITVNYFANRVYHKWYTNESCHFHSTGLIWIFNLTDTKQFIYRTKFCAALKYYTKHIPYRIVACK